MADTAVDSSNPPEAVVSSLMSPIPTPTYAGTKGVFTVRSSTTIHASVDTVFTATTNISDFPKWNTFVPNASITGPPNTTQHIQVGTEMIFQVCMKGKGTPTRSSTEVVTVIEELGDGRKGRRVAWKSPRMGLKTERVQEVVEIDAGDPSLPRSPKTEYTTWSTFNGPLAYFLKFTFGNDLVDRFGDWSKDLKSYCEAIECSDSNTAIPSDSTHLDQPLV